MIYMATNAELFEIHSTGCYLALSTQHRNSVLLPSVPRRARPRPSSLHPAPAHGPFLGTEAGPAIDTPPVAIRVVAAVNCLEYFCSSVSARWTTHCASLASPDCCHWTPMDRTLRLSQECCSGELTYWLELQRKRDS